MANVIQFTINAKDQASGRLAKFSASFDKLVKVATRATAVVAGATVATVGFTAAVARSTERTTQFARRLGVTSRNLSAYEFAAEQSAIQTNQFDMAVQRMTRRVGEATQGTGEAINALAELNINVQEFSTLGLDRQLEIVANRFEQVENPADKLRLAFKLFDAEGTAMLQLLNQGSEQLREFARDAEFLGVVIDARLAANTEVFQQRLRRATGSLKGLSNAVADELMPTLAGLADRFANLVATNRENIAKFVSEAVENFAVFLQVAGQVFSRFKAAFDQALTLEGFTTFLERLFQGMSDLVQAWITLWLETGPSLVRIIATAFQAALAAGLQLVTEGGQLIADKLFEIFGGGPAVDASKRFAEIIGEAVSNVSADLQGLGPDVEFVATAMGERLTAAAELIGDTFGINLDLAREQARLALEQLQLFGEVAEEQAAETVNRARTIMEELQLINEQYLANVGTMQMQMAEGLFNTIQGGVDLLSQAVAQSIVAGDSLIEGLRNAAKAVMVQLLKMLSQIALRRLITSAIAQGAEASESASELSSGIAAAGVNAFASTAAIPIVGPGLAPAAAQAAIAGATATATQGLAIGKGLAAGGVGGAAHGGLENVPAESTFLLQRGERVLSPTQNRDLTDFLATTARANERATGPAAERVVIAGLPPGALMSTDHARDLLALLAEARGDDIAFDP